MTQSASYPSAKAGLPPGTLMHVGKEPASPATITAISFSSNHLEEGAITTLDDLHRFLRPDAITWVHCEGLHTGGLLEEFGREFGVHPLVLEDILNTHQRPKFEEYDNYLFLVLKTLSGSKDLVIQHEQISLLMFQNVLFTFRERQDGLFDQLKQRLLNARGRIRTLGTDYLVYTIMDTVVDHYFTLADTLEEVIESIEVKLLTRARAQTLRTLQRLKREMVFIRKAITPLREVLGTLQRCESALISAKTEPYFRDVFDHILRVIDTLDSHRDLINGMLEIYLTSLSNRMNEIMKVLTVFATIFIPLTFVVGIYGMNFDFMPELHWKWSYPVLWGLFILIPSVLLYIFKKKNWL